MKDYTLLGFDFGIKQTGVAVGQTFLKAASPLAILKMNNGLPNWKLLAETIANWQPDGFVVGLPLNMDGSVSELSLRAHKFAKRLHGHFHKPYFLQDERLTSVEAKQQAYEQGHRGNYKKKPVDSFAAVIILENWLHRSDLLDLLNN